MNKATKVLLTIAVMVAILGFYFYLLGRRGFSLIQTGGAVNIGLGVGVILLPIIGLWIVWATLKAGFEHQHLASRIREENLELDVSEMPRMPSGRISREAADELFQQIKGEWEKDPDNWRNSYRLARAYDYAGDRGRARETMKRAVALEREDSASR
ncbi:tetratricopeptide repeat protein [Rhodococcoides kyotonense]|uniref:Tetratricopeptide repeat-containing protein n=1 Tax=Rhodococcoides kyotonense TaxID=398843 RepID=A0A239D3S3_9NOCA|nr:tetratricopeptide repeat protein [Rhodococcus kyotonensis]SNS26792.1 hypothetical protein SAMN05421642_101357 [Rhodococcus kyotonensis]